MKPNEESGLTTVTVIQSGEKSNNARPLSDVTGVNRTLQITSYENKCFTIKEELTEIN